MYSINISGRCSWFNPLALEKAQKAANFKRLSLFPDQSNVKKSHRISSKTDFFNRIQQLYNRKTHLNLITLTLPSLFNSGIFQQSNDCSYTGDKVVTECLSKFLEALSIKLKRERNFDLSYIWVAERQNERRSKFGGVGDIHFHIVTNLVVKRSQYIPEAKKERVLFMDKKLIDWIARDWCKTLGVKFDSTNCIDVRFIHKNMGSVCNYVAKYLSKRDPLSIPILSRKFASSKDLVKIRPIHSDELPDVSLYRIHETKYQYNGKEHTNTVFYFDSWDIKKFYYDQQEMAGEAYAKRVHLCLTKSDKPKTKFYNCSPLTWQKYFATNNYNRFAPFFPKFHGVPISEISV